MPSIFAHISGKKNLPQKTRNANLCSLDRFTTQNLAKNKKNSEKSLIDNHERTYTLFPRTFENGVSYNLYKLWLEGRLCDVEVSVGRDTIKAHKVRLYNELENSWNAHNYFMNTRSNSLDWAEMFCLKCYLFAADFYLDFFSVIFCLILTRAVTSSEISFGGPWEG